MAAPYPELGINDTANLYTLTRFANNGVGDLFMPVMLAVIWIVALIGGISEGRESSRSFIFASFICSILAILLSMVALLNSQYMYFLFLMTGAGVVWYQLANAPGI